MFTQRYLWHRIFWLLQPTLKGGPGQREVQEVSSQNSKQPNSWKYSLLQSIISILTVGAPPPRFCPWQRPTHRGAAAPEGVRHSGWSPSSLLSSSRRRIKLQQSCTGGKICVIKGVERIWLLQQWDRDQVRNKLSKVPHSVADWQDCPALRGKRRSLSV